MNLGYDYIIVGSIIIVLLLSLYIYRKTRFKSLNDKSSIAGFKKDLKIFLKQTYPKIPFEFSIYEEVKNEKDSRVSQTLIAENMALQLANFEFKLTTQPGVKKEFLWTTYEFDSKPVKDTLPKDLKKRKELAFQRDKNSCIRCGKKLKIENASIIFIKQVRQGGSYHFENIATFCSDCNKILKSKNPASVSKDLIIIDEILAKAHF